MGRTAGSVSVQVSQFALFGAPRRTAGFLALLTSISVPALAPAAEPPQLDEVVVTATKRPEFAKDVPIALTAIGEKELARRQASDLLSLQSMLPNVSFLTSGNSLLIDPVIRGVSSNTRNAGVESGLAVYVDGVYTGRPETFNTALDDVRMVAVLRGPQGTLFGKNAIAGAMSVTTQDPTGDLSGRASVEYGSQEYLRLSGHLNLPLPAGRGGVRIAAFRGVRDGYVRNLFDGGTVGNDDYWGGRLKARFVLTSALDLVLAADYRKDDRRPYLGENPYGREPLSRQVPKPIIAPGPFTTNEDHRPNEETRILWGT